MDDRGFIDWLNTQPLAPNTIQSAVTDVRRIAVHYGDLDAQYAENGLEGVLQDFEYSAIDARNDEPNPTRLDLGGNVRHQIAGYKSALRRYIRFREDTERAAPPARDPETEARADATFRLERDLQSALRANLGQIEPGLAAIDGGAERAVETGRIDILARDGAGRTVVIELKAVTAPPATLAQTLGYMHDMQAEGGDVRGLIVAPDFHPRLVAAARLVPGLELRRYAVRFELDPVD